MDERAALERIEAELPGAGDDAAVVDGLVLTTDMLHDRADFPAGTTRYTAGWRAVGASLSDVAAMGAEAVGTVAAYGAPDLLWDEIAAFVAGARAVSEACDGAYVGGDLDVHDEFTVATAALGRTDAPLRWTRPSASPARSGGPARRSGCSRPARSSERTTSSGFGHASPPAGRSRRSHRR